jgi:hypothetical protein
MFPWAKGSYSFNDADEEEWQISHDTDTTFVVYGTLWIFSKDRGPGANVRSREKFLYLYSHSSNQAFEDI